LLRVAGNRCRTKMAKRATQAKTQLLNEDLDVKLQPDLTTPALILEEVQAALELLRPEYQHVFSLFHFHHRSFEEIAIEMKVPYATVKTWCHRARKEMAEILERRGNLNEELGAVPSRV
jgi:RNA polymerase sigma-70 factor (ECF subfamily)